MHSAVERLEKGLVTAPPPVEVKAPAVPIRKSITPDFLICLEDGKRLRFLRRHLAGHGLTPEQYREKWNLPSDYPMVAPSYAAVRSAMAKKMGLGQIGGKSELARAVGGRRRPRRNRRVSRRNRASVEAVEVRRTQGDCVA